MERATKWGPWPLARFLRATYEDHRNRMTALHAIHTNHTGSLATAIPTEDDPTPATSCKHRTKNVYLVWS